MAKYELKVGADPEMFIKKGRSYQCAEGVIPGSKYEPHIVDKGAVQVDGMAVEFNIDPANTEDEFVDHLGTVMTTLGNMVDGHELICKPSVTFNKKVWEGASEEAKILGCEPDYNAWTGEVNPKPIAPKGFRTAAGHIHIGWTEDADIKDQHHINECEAIVRELDFRLGYPSLLLDPDTDRRTLYGKAGAYRPKSYGVEYRVLSNFWLKEEELQRWVYRVVKKTLEDMSIRGHNRAEGGHKVGSRYNPMKIIDEGVVDDAKSFINDFPFMVMPNEI